MKTIIIDGIVEGLNKAVVGFLKWIALGLIDSSYIICLTACFIALILYVAGQKKAGKYISISFIIYVILQSIRGLLI